MRRTISLLFCVTACLLLAVTSGIAYAYEGPALVVDSYFDGGGMGAGNLLYAVDGDPSTYARLGFSGGWVVYRYADNQPRLVTSVSWKYGSASTSPGLTLYAESQTEVASTDLTTTTGTWELPEPMHVLSFRIVGRGGNYTYLYDLQPHIIEPPVPGVPTGLAVPEVTHNRVRLVWESPADGGDVEEYRIYRNGVHIGTTQTTTYTDTDVTPLAEYSYEVSAWNVWGESPRSAPALVTVPEEPIVPPPAPPAGLEITPTVRGLMVSWSPSPEADVVAYAVYLDGQMLDQITGTAYDLAGLDPDRSYTVAVTAISSGGLESAPVIATGQPLAVPTEPPGPVRGLTYTVGAGRVTLRWQPPDTGGPVEEYRISRNGDQVAITQNTQWSDDTVQPASEYEYSISASNAIGVSAPVTARVRTPEEGLLEGVRSSLSGLGSQVNTSIRLLLPFAMAAAGLMIARVVLWVALAWFQAKRREA